VVGGVVESDRFVQVFGRAVDGLHARLLSEDTAGRVVNLQAAVTRAVDAIAVVRPQLAQRIQDASGQITFGKGTTGKRLAQIAHRAQQLRVLGILLPIIALVLLALSIAVAADRLRATRRAGWVLIVGGIVVSAVSGLTHRVLTGIVDQAEVRAAVGATESAFLADLGTWGAWVVGIGVVVLATAIFLASPLTFRERATRAWDATTSRPARPWAIVWRVLALIILVLLVVVALDAVLKILVGVAVGLVVAYAIAQLLRLAGVGTRRPEPGAGG
jgi:hypothetical protein